MPVVRVRSPEGWAVSRAKVDLMEGGGGAKGEDETVVT